MNIWTWRQCTPRTAMIRYLVTSSFSPSWRKTSRDSYMSDDEVQAAVCQVTGKDLRFISFPQVEGTPQGTLLYCLTMRWRKFYRRRPQIYPFLQVEGILKWTLLHCLTMMCKQLCTRLQKKASDFFLFAKLKEYLKGPCYMFDDEVQATVYQVTGEDLRFLPRWDATTSLMLAFVCGPGWQLHWKLMAHQVKGHSKLSENV